MNLEKGNKIYNKGKEFTIIDIQFHNNTTLLEIANIHGLVDFCNINKVKPIKLTHVIVNDYHEFTVESSDINAELLTKSFTKSYDTIGRFYNIEIIDTNKIKIKTFNQP